MTALSAKLDSDPWWRRGWARITAGVLAAGALASAVGAVTDLWPDPDAVHKADVTSLQILSRAPLSEYQRRLPEMVPGSSRATPRPGGFVLVADVEDDPTAQPIDEPTEAPTDDPTDGATVEPTDEPSETPSPDEPAEPSSPEVSQEPPGPDEEVDLGGEVDPGWPGGEESASPATEPVVDEMRTSNPDLALPGRNRNPDGAQMLDTLVDAVSTDDFGDPLPPRVAARRLTRVFEETRAVPKPNGKLDPVGMVLDANLLLEGLRERPIDVSWTLWSRGTRLYGNWLRPVEVSDVTVSADGGTAAVQFWVPLPSEPGRYQVRLAVVDGSTVLTTELSEPFGRR